MLPIKVLLVDDFQPLRRLVRSFLQSNNFQVIGEASDGLEAVSKAEQLRPDLIILDIGIPKLNGFEVARRLQQHMTRAKIIFLSEESSSAVVREAFNLGAGYIQKPQAYTELLPAINAVLGGKRFVGDAVKSVFSEIELPSYEHEMLIYSDKRICLESFTHFISTALRAGRPAISIARRNQLDSIVQSLECEGIDAAAATKHGTLVLLDVIETLSEFIVDGSVEPVRFMNSATDLIHASVKIANGARIAACGICAPVLLERGNSAAAIRLEQLWDDLAEIYELDILCAYPSSGM